MPIAVIPLLFLIELLVVWMKQELLQVEQIDSVVPILSLSKKEAHAFDKVRDSYVANPRDRKPPFWAVPDT